MPSSVARQTLERAKFFNRRANVVAGVNREHFQHFLEASVVFGRSVTFHLQKEFSRIEGFDTWYAGVQQEMSDDPICRFFLSKRNYILREGPVSIGYTISVVISERLEISDHVEIEVIRETPWYRRPPKILWEDLRDRLLRPLRKLVNRIQTLRQPRREKRARLAMEMSDHIHFDEADFSHRPATEVVSDYIGYLEEVVEEAEDRFASS